MTAIHYRPKAVAQFKELIAYVEAQNPSTAIEMYNAIIARIELAAQHPRLAIKVNRSNVYRCPISPYRVTFFYRHRPRRDEIQILRIVRGVRIRNLKQMPRTS